MLSPYAVLSLISSFDTPIPTDDSLVRASNLPDVNNKFVVTSQRLCDFDEATRAVEGMETTTYSWLLCAAAILSFTIVVTVLLAVWANKKSTRWWIVGTGSLVGVACIVAAGTAVFISPFVGANVDNVHTAGRSVYGKEWKETATYTEVLSRAGFYNIEPFYVDPMAEYEDIVDENGDRDNDRTPVDRSYDMRMRLENATPFATQEDDIDRPVFVAHNDSMCVGEEALVMVTKEKGQGDNTYTVLTDCVH